MTRAQSAPSDGVDLFAAAPDGIVVVDDDGVITTVNDARSARCSATSRPSWSASRSRSCCRSGSTNVTSNTARRTRRSRPGGRWGCRSRCTAAASRRRGISRSTSASTTSATPTGGLRVIAFVRDATARDADGGGATRERGELPPARGGRRRPRDLHARPVGPGRDVEPGRAAHQGLERRRDPRPALLGVLPPRRRRVRPARARPRARRPPKDGRRARGGACAPAVNGSGPRPRCRPSATTTGTLRGFAKVTRDRTESHQARARLESVGELNRAVLEQRPEDELLALVVSRARAMVERDARRGVVARRRSGDELVVTYAEGDGASALLGTRARRRLRDHDGRRARRAPRVVARPAAPTFACPRELADAGHGLGTVRAAARRRRDLRRDRRHDGARPRAAAAARGRPPAGVRRCRPPRRSRYARARREVEQLHLVSERERIARDLHDSVIQRLFAVGLSLEATSRRPAAETAGAAAPGGRRHRRHDPIDPLVDLQPRGPARRQGRAAHAACSRSSPRRRRARLRAVGPVRRTGRHARRTTRSPTTSSRRCARRSSNVARHAQATLGAT